MKKQLKQPKALKTVSLYTGCGGLDYGFEAAGFKTCVGVEFDKDCCATIEANRSWPMICRDIHDTPCEEILKTGGLKAGEVDILLGGPPCQPFSKSSYWIHGDSRRLEDPRSTTLHAYMRCVEAMLPEVFLLENVHGISYSGKEEGFELLAELTAKVNKKRGANYQLSWKVLNAADYGVPQLRVRFFLVGHRDGGHFVFPHTTHIPSDEGTNVDRKKQLSIPGVELPEYVKAWDAIGGFRPTGEALHIRGSWADLYHQSQREKTTFGIQTEKVDALFWVENPLLELLAEAVKTATFLDNPVTTRSINWPPFTGKTDCFPSKKWRGCKHFLMISNSSAVRTSIQRQIGNAVPSLLAEVLARAIAEQFFAIEYECTPKLAVQLKRPIPAPEPTKPVPRKYRSMMGDHADHPGEGKGSGAKQKHDEEREVYSQPKTLVRI